MTLGGTAGGTLHRTLGATAGGTLKRTMGGTLHATLGATGDVPPIAPGEGLPGDDSAPTTPRPQGTFAMLQAALASDDEEDSEGEPLSPTLMSICRPSSQSPTRRDLNSSLGDSPSIILVEDTHWTPCKPLPRQTHEEIPPACSPSPCSPPAPCSKRKARKERPVRCLSPEPLSARGRERHAQEMAALGLPVDAPRSARRLRPQGGVRHIAVVGERKATAQ